VLCLAGSGDRINPPSTVSRIAARYHGRARFEEIRGHSHWLIDEPGWEKIATRAMEWLDSVSVADGVGAKQRD
jgi:pimeloyl-ACP methyl ester carboxylesterase